MIRRQTLKTLSLYACSIALFWNLVIAIRAYRFTHFEKSQTSTTVVQASFWDYVTSRVTGSKYYKLPVTKFPTTAYQTVAINTNDNKQLEAWHMPTANSKGTCILFHGLGGNKQTMLQEAYGLQAMGYAVLNVDFRAHGNSQGNASTIGGKEAADVKAAYDYVKALGETNIVLYGASMGAASISSCLHQYKDVQPTKVILDMPFDNFENLMVNFYRDSKYPSQPTFKLFTFWASVFNKTWLFDVKPSNYVKSIKCPTLIQWGRQDQLVPQESIDNIVANITAPKTFKVYESLGHQSFIQEGSKEWQETVSNFLH